MAEDEGSTTSNNSCYLRVILSLKLLSNCKEIVANTGRNKDHRLCC